MSRVSRSLFCLLATLFVGCGSASAPIAPDSTCASRLDAETLESLGVIVTTVQDALAPSITSGEASLLTLSGLQQLLTEEQWAVVTDVLAQAEATADQEDLSCDRTEDRDRFEALNIGTASGNQQEIFYVLADAATDLQALLAAAASDDIGLTITSAHRHAGYQVFLLLSYASQYEGCLSDELQWVALPNASEHVCSDRQAIDFATVQGELVSEGSAAASWLSQHAAQFGFTRTYPSSGASGISSEPWHWCWHPGDAAATSSPVQEE